MVKKRGDIKNGKVRSSHLKTFKKLRKMAGTDGENTGKNTFSDYSRFDQRENEKYEFCRKTLIRNYYWCDVLDFARMRVPLRELIAYANLTLETGDILNDVPHFFFRAKNAQKHALAYLDWAMKHIPKR